MTESKEKSPESTSCSLPAVKHYDYFIIGGGSGGIASARRAAFYKKVVGVADGGAIGGTCVNVGCIPKKVMYNAANINHILCSSLSHYGFEILDPMMENAKDDKKLNNYCPLKKNINFDWMTLKSNRDLYIQRLNNIYLNKLKEDQIDFYPYYASFTIEKSTFNDPNQKKARKIKLTKFNSQGKIEKELFVTAEHILIATGSKPSKLNIPGEEYAINSDDFFKLEKTPNKVAVIGAGYIAVELSSILNFLGVETHLFFRYNEVLRSFDEIIKKNIMLNMKNQGIHLHPNSCVSSIELNEKKEKNLCLVNSERHENFSDILVAIGRNPNYNFLNDSCLSFLKKSSNHLAVDKFQNTSIDKIYALGDVCGTVELTPMAIAAGRRLSDRLFGGIHDAKVSYELVPSAIFSHPPAATVGLTEAEAKQRYGENNIKIYRNTSVNTFYAIYNISPSMKPKTEMKMICLLPDEKILGIHVVGMGADEMMQGFAVAIKMGATKSDFDNCIAIHPTASEEFVTMPPWGLSEQQFSKYK